MQDVSVSPGVNQQIINLADPTSDQDAATKAYVDSIAGSSFTEGAGIDITGEVISIDLDSPSGLELVGSPVEAAKLRIDLTTTDALEITAGGLDLKSSIAADRTFTGTAITISNELQVDGLLDLNGSVDADVTSFDVLSSGAISLDAGATSNFTTSTGNILIEATTGDVEVKLGDASGVNEFRILDSGSIEVASIDSDGNISLSGDLTGVTNIIGAGDIVIQASGSPDGDVCIILGDNGGISKFKIQDSDLVNIVTADSNGNLIVSGDVTVLGTTTTIDSTTLTVVDNIILLNEGDPGPGVTLGSSGIEIERGQSASPPTATNVQIIWSESHGQWRVSDTAGTFYDIITEKEISDGLIYATDLLKVDPNGDSIEVSSSGVRANNLKEQKLALGADPAVSSGKQATGLTLSDKPADGAKVIAFVNGVKYEIGGATTGFPFYFSDDGGTTAESLVSLASGDELIWDTTELPFDLETNDVIEIAYDAIV